MLGLPDNVKRIEEIISDNPRLKDYAKFVNRDRFEQIGFVIFSQPQTHENITIYGLFLLDKDNTKANLINKDKSKDEVVQDFIAYDRDADSIIYYSGRGKKTGGHQNISKFCEAYGRDINGQWGEYGCISDKYTTNHRYKDENDPHLPVEEWIRKRIAEKATSFRSKL